MNYTIYSKTTGQIIKNLFCLAEELPVNYDSSVESYLELEINGNEYYVDISNQQLVQIPSRPNNWSNFDFVTKQWVGNESQAIIFITNRRKKILYESDWTQIPNNPLTSEQQTAWATYRQELRDIPSQSGYPFNVVWPTPPQG